MVFQSLLFSVIYLLLLLITIPILRRYSGLRLGRQVVIPAVILSASLFALYYWDLIDGAPSENSAATTMILWMTIITLAVYSFNKLVIWIISELVVKPGHLKIPTFLLNLAGGLVLAVAILLSLSMIFGVELSGILLTSTIASAIIGFSLQDTLSNLFSGVSLQIEAPFAIDDWVEIGGHEGRVVSQNWRSLMLLTRQNHRISLTNQFVASDKIINYSRPTRRQIQVIFIGLDYSHPPNRVKQIMIDFLNSVEECEYDPENPPFVAGFQDYAIEYGLRFWIKDYKDIIQIQDLVYTRLWYIFNREGIHIPYPIVVHKNVESAPQAFEEQPLTAADIEKMLHSFELFHDMEADQIEKLATFSTVQLYSKGERLVREGDDGDSLFMISSGEVDITIKGDFGQNILVQQKRPGDFFGEMSLLTGEPRSATVTAKSDADVIVINKDAFTSILVEDPSILNNLLDRLEKQKINLQTQRTDNASQRGRNQRSSRDVLLERIWSYLGLR